MIQWFSGICQKVTDFLPGSKIRTKFEAIAVELEAMDFAFYQAAKKAIPIAIYQAFSFDLLPPTKAAGTVVFTANQAPVTNVTIPSGTRLATAGSASVPEKLYETTATVTLLAGNTSIEAPVASVTAGIIGNTGINNIRVVKATIAGITSATNAAALINGSDKETENERRSRFIDYIAGLRRGTNGAIVTGAKTAAIVDSSGIVIEEVVTALVDEPGTPAGYITCYIYNGTGSTSDALIAKTRQIIDGYVDSDGKRIAGYKAAGIVCVVTRATETPLNITATVAALAGYDQAVLQVQLETAIAAYLQGLDIGQDCLRNEIIERIMATEGVYNCDLIAPANDLTAEKYTVFTPHGLIAVTVN